MAEESELSKAAGEIAKMFLAISFKLSARDNPLWKEPGDYFRFSMEAGKPYISLQSLYDKREMRCFSKEELRNAIDDTVQNTELINSLKARTQGEKFDIALFNALGGCKSELLQNSRLIDARNEQQIIFHLNDSFEQGHRMELSKDGSYYNIAIAGEGVYNQVCGISVEELPKIISRELTLKEEYRLTGKFRFRKDEIPIKELNNVGVYLENLSKSDIKRLLLGNETGILTIVARNKVGEKHAISGHIKLGRNPDGTAFAAFRRSLTNQIAYRRNIS